MLGVPGATDVRYPYQIAQRHGAVAIRYQFAHPSEIDRDHILYEATLSEPEPFTRPWKMRFLLRRRVVKNVRLLEHECQWFKSGGRYKATPLKPSSQYGWWDEAGRPCPCSIYLRWDSYS